MMKDTPLAKYLRMLRDNQGLKQDEVARQLGITRGTYSHYENGRLTPPADALYKLSSIFHVSLEQLIRLSMEKDGEDSVKFNSAEVVEKDEDIQQDSDAIYNSFLSECADMSKDRLAKWVTIEDRELIYYYHRLSGRDKRIVKFFLKALSLMK
jgi:transcriptional regulator with XRE-family HTH domain